METLHLTQYIANECQRYGPVTPMKLQKLLYYVEAWGQVAGCTLIGVPFEKWEYGPVNPEVYRAYKSHGREPIDYVEVPHVPTGQRKELTDFIATCYAQHSALALSAMTHREDPWRQTPKNAVIPTALMRRYYSRQPFAQNFPFDPNRGPFIPVDSDAQRVSTMDMSEEEARQVRTYASYHEYLRRIQQARGEYKQWYNELLA